MRELDQLVATGIAVLLVLLWMSVPWGIARLRHRERRRNLTARKSAPQATVVTPEAAVIVELLVAGLQTGAGIPRALQATGQCMGGSSGRELAAVGTALLLGAPWEQAWKLSPPSLGFLARALRPAWEHGAPPTSVLAATRARMMRQNSERTEVAAQKLAVHLVLPLGLCFLPSFILIGVVPILFSLGGALLFGG